MGEKPAEGGGLIFNLDAKRGGENGQRRLEGRARASQPFNSFSVVSQRRGSCGASLLRQAVEIGLGVAVVIGESAAPGNARAGGFKSGKELCRPRDAAKRKNRAVERRDLHRAPQPPDGAMPAAGTEVGFEGGIIRWNGNDRRSFDGRHRFPQVARGKQAILQIGSAHKENVHIAMELAVLEAVVEEMDTSALRVHLRFRQNAGIVPLGSNPDRHARRARNQQRFVAVLPGRTGRIHPRSRTAAAPVAAGENVNGHSSRGERQGQRNGQRRLSCAAGGKIADERLRAGASGGRARARSAGVAGAGRGLGDRKA